MRFVAIAGVLFVGLVAAEDQEALSPETVLVKQGDIEFTVGDFDAAAMRIPENLRAGYMADFTRVINDLENMLAMRVVSDRAREDGYLERPDVKAELALHEDQLLAAKFVTDWVAAQPSPDYEQQAREKYLANRADYKEPRTVDVSHILIKDDRRTDDEAKAMAEDILAQAKQGDRETFAELAREHSEDQGSAGSGGMYPGAKRDGLVKPFADAAFSAQELNAPFGPIRTRFGYHVMMVHKFNDPRQKSFEEVKAQIIPGLREAHIAAMRRDYYNDVRTAEKEVNEDAIKHLRQRYAGDLLEDLREKPPQGE